LRAVDARVGDGKVVQPEQLNAHVVPTLDDVAHVAGVSRTTVSRVVNGGQLVARATRDRVRDVVAQLGYRPNLAARALVTRRVGTVALIVPESGERVFADPFFSQAYRGALAAFAGSDAQVVLVVPQPGDVLRYLHSGQVDGAIITSHHGRELAEALTPAPPVVFIGHPGVDSIPYVDLDQVRAARAATRYLLDAGASRLGMITGPLDMSPGAGRLDGFQQELAEAGVAPAGVELSDFSMRGGESAAQRLIGHCPDVDAIVVGNDLMAVGVMRALALAGRTVPHDVRVIGFDNSVIGQQTVPQLTSMTNPAAEMARIAGGMLRALLAGESPRWPVIVTSELVVRGSA